MEAVRSSEDVSPSPPPGQGQRCTDRAKNSDVDHSVPLFDPQKVVADTVMLLEDLCIFSSTVFKSYWK